MNRRLLYVAVAAAVAASPAVAARPVQSATTIEVGTSYRLSSAALGSVREVNVWLPSDYSRGKRRYPVLYLLDGGVDQDFVHIAGLGQLASLSWTFGPFIVVGIRTGDRRAELTPPASDPRYRRALPESGGAARFRAFLRRDLIPFVEGRFRTDGRRAIMGESLAGLFVVDTLLNDPTLANDYVAISLSLWWDDRRAFRALADAGPDTRHAGRRLYLAIADEGGTMQDGVDRLRGYLERGGPSGIALRYADMRASADHSTIYHRAAEQALRWLYPVPPETGITTPWYMIDGAAPPAGDGR